MANEQETACRFVKEVLHFCTEVGQARFYAVLDHKSTDDTLALLNHLQPEVPELRIVWAPENKCVVDAYLRGYWEAIEDRCDWILEIDAGYSHDPSEIPAFLETISQGYDCVFGSRFMQGGQFSGSAKRYIVSRGGTLLVNLLLGTRLTDMTSGFEMFTRGSLQRILEKGIYSNGHFFQTEIKVHARTMTAIEIPIHYQLPSDSLTGRAVKDAMLHLFRLFKLRLKKNM